MRTFAALALGLAIAPPGGAQERPDPAAASRAIDAHLKKAWGAANLRPARLAGDEEFLRRATLDLTGTIPRSEEVERFVRDRDPRKRAKKIDELLASRAHAKYWAQLWTVALLDWSNFSYEAYDREEFRDWLEEQFAAGVPWNRITRAILSAGGTPVENRAANFNIRYLTEGPEAFTTRVTKTFLGVRLSCAQCHDHPFDQWRTEDFYGLASFVARSTAGYTSQDSQAGLYELLEATAGDGLQPQGFNSPVKPKYLNGLEPATNLWRQEFAVFLTRDPQFARAFVNRTWSQLMGRGIVHPPENFSRKNPPTHPELLEELTRDFTARGSDVRHLLRAIAGSNAYQLSSENAAFKPGDEKWFPFAIPKPLNPWQTFNAFARASGLERDYASEPARFSADREAFVGTFLDALDTDATAANLYHESSQNLLTKLSRDYLADAGITEASSILTRLAAAPPYRQVEILHLAVLGRLPSADERRICAQFLQPARLDDPAGPLRDLFYALVNSHEFNFNH